MTETAPWLAKVTDMRPRPETIWRRTEDGVRLRLAIWQPADGSRGSVLLFPGRTEHVEKYAETAGSLMRAGFAVIAVDWRGQGLSDRLASPPQMGHVGRFGDYQRDVAALTGAAEGAALPRPWHLLAHSMGGAIGLRALHCDLAVESAAFSAPMWGIVVPPEKLTRAWIFSTAARALGLGARFAPGEGPDCYAATVHFDGNMLTSDRSRFLENQRELRTSPEVALGGVSLGWLGAALWETRALARLPAPALPALVFLGGDEEIVRTDAIRNRMAHWSGGELVEFPGARHELLLEVPDVRDGVIRRAVALFLRAGA